MNAINWEGGFLFAARKERFYCIEKEGDRAEFNYWNGAASMRCVFIPMIRSFVLGG